MPPPHNKRQKYKRVAFAINGVDAAAIASGISYHPSIVKIWKTSPEVDQEIVIDSCGKRLYRGRFYDVKITDCEDYDLYASLVYVD